MDVITKIESTCERTNFYANIFQNDNWTGKAKPTNEDIKKFPNFSKGESGRRNETGIDQKDWFIGVLYAILNSHNMIVTQLIKIAEAIGKKEVFITIIKKFVRKIQISDNGVTVKFNERGSLYSYFFLYSY